MPRIAWRRTFRLAAVIFAGGLIVALISLVPDILRFVPPRYRPWWVEIVASVALAVHAIARVLCAGWLASTEATQRVRRALAQLDLLAAKALKRGLAVALSALCVVILAGWIPHYLTWMMSRDDDTFAVLAQSWDSGILPYRDIRAYNFPGQIYLFWALGKTFGWGCPVAVRGFDALCVVVAGMVMVGWSRARLAGVVPGLIGYRRLHEQLLRSTGRCHRPARLVHGPARYAPGSRFWRRGRDTGHDLYRRSSRPLRS